MSTIWSVQGYLIQLQAEIRRMRVDLEVRGKPIDRDALYLWESNLYSLLCHHGFALTEMEFVRLVPETPDGE